MKIDSPQKRSYQQKIRRRNLVLALLLLLLIAAVIFFFCGGDENEKKSKKSISVGASVTAAAVTDAAQAILTTTTAMTLPTEPEVLSTDSCELAVTPVLQNPELPTGCEITALTMALNYAGYPVDKLTMADQYLIRSDPYLTTFGEAFVGSPHDSTAWGCYAPVIRQTAEKYIAAQGGTELVQDLTGCSLKTLLAEVANGTPVVTWATIGMTTNVTERYYWTTEKGEDAVFLINEHCVLLTGYDLSRNIVIVCDPLEGRMEYDMDMFEDRYQRVYEQAVVIRQTTENAETAAS